MRVLLISWEYPPVIEGGLGRHVRKLSEELARTGVEMHVLTRGGGQERGGPQARRDAGTALDELARKQRHGAPSEEERHGVFIHRVGEPPFPRDADRFVRWVERMNEHMTACAERLLQRFEFDLVHSHDWLVADAAERIARAGSLPWLCTIHATEYGRHQGWVDKPPQSLIHARELAMARSADRLITCSHYMRGHVTRVFGVAPRKVTVIPNGIDPRELEPRAADLPALRARFAEPDELLVLLVGRLVFEKGFHLALDALAPVIRRRRGVRFVVAGTGTAEHELKRQADRLGLSRHGTFLGWVGDDMLHSLYRVSDLCIVPSIYEPFGLVALEAMASGCLCIVADTGGLREVVPGDETVGLRFPAEDSEALRVLLERVLTDDAARTRLIDEAREHVLRFDWREVATRTRRAYGRLVARTRSVR
jgi:glycogen(starch) synthase